MSEKYKDVVEQAINLGAYGLAAQLRAERTKGNNACATFLSELIISTAELPKIPGPGSGQIWHTLDIEIELYARLLPAAVRDCIVRPISVPGKEFEVLRDRLVMHKISAAQIELVGSCLGLLPESTQAFVRDKDNTFDERVYPKTRSALLEFLALQWATNQAVGLSDIAFELLTKTLRGRYSDLVLGAIRKEDEKTGVERLSRTLLHLEAVVSPVVSTFSSSLKECFSSLSMRWMKELPRLAVGPVVEFHQRAGDLSKKSHEALWKHTATLARIEMVSKSFLEVWKFRDISSWKITSIDPGALAITIVRPVQDAWRPGRIEGETREVRQRIAEWVHPDPAVKLTVELRGDVAGEKNRCLFSQKIRNRLSS